MHSLLQTAPKPVLTAVASRFYNLPAGSWESFKFQLSRLLRLFTAQVSQASLCFPGDIISVQRRFLYDTYINTCMKHAQCINDLMCVV